jgi:prephenate dehydrogenase
VSNSREFEQGCLRITLPDPESVKNAVRLLSDKGYKVYKI